MVAAARATGVGERAEEVAVRAAAATGRAKEAAKQAASAAVGGGAARVTVWRARLDRRRRLTKERVCYTPPRCGSAAVSARARSNDSAALRTRQGIHKLRLN